MRIGIDIRPLMSATRSGVGEYTYELLNAIFAIDKTNQYFLFYNSAKDVSRNIPEWSQDNIHYEHKKWPNKLFNACIKLFNFPKIDKNNLDYFFSTNFNFTALSKKTKHILTVHDLSFEFFPELYSYKQRLWHWAINPKKQCEKADTLLTPSENTKRDIINFYRIPQERIKVIYPGVNCHSEQGEESLSAEKIQTKQKYNLPTKFILFLGTIEPRKNIIGLIEAFEQSYPLLPTPYSLIIAGHKGWNDKKIYQKFESSPYKDKIKFIGSIDQKDKSSLYSLASLFVYPSFYEGFGFPVVEAMAYGVPVITSNRSSLPEVADQAAYLINPNRPSELARAITEILNNQKLGEHFKALGLEQAKKFNWEKAAREFLQVVS
jgi:glycosyltransferase involved in cell wall biosynthesis